MLNRSKIISLLERQKESGLSVKRFCSNECIAPSTFFYWRKKIRKDTIGQGFIPLVVRNPSAPCILFSSNFKDNFGTKTGHMKKQERLNRQEEMLTIIEQWQESGNTQQTFCKEHDLTYTTFYYWLKRYRRRIDENGFLPVEISSGSYIEIRYPGGVIWQLPAATRLATIKQLLSL